MSTPETTNAADAADASADAATVNVILERADSESPKLPISPTTEVDVGGDADTEVDIMVDSKTNDKILIDLSKIPDGNYEYRTDSGSVISVILSYMYHTLHNVVQIKGDGPDSVTETNDASIS